jgi:hypothetical protein
MPQRVSPKDTPRDACPTVRARAHTHPHVHPTQGRPGEFGGPVQKKNIDGDQNLGALL